MGKRKKSGGNNNLVGPDLLTRLEGRRRSGLVLRRFLVEEAEKFFYRGEQQDKAHGILKDWAKLEAQGDLAKKETALDAHFLREVFTDALGYLPVTQSPENYQLEAKFVIPGAGEADAALGNFSRGTTPSPVVIMELKGAGVNLDKDRFNGRTPVQQCWDYLNALPKCPWGILSNFVTFRLYHRTKGSLAYEEFTLQELRDPKKFRQFYCLFERGGLVRAPAGQYLRAPHLLEKTENRQREVGDKLYDQYSEERYRLIEHLQHKLGKNLETAIHVAQKLLDRIIFVAFCEDRGLLPEKCIDKAYSTLPPFSKVTNPRWQNFLALFEAVDQGHPQLLGIDTGYDGGLFEHDDEVDNLQLEDEWTHFFRAIGGYDFRDEVNVDVLGHLFEKSVGELEEIQLVGLFGAGEKGAREQQGPQPAMRKSAERKRLGTYYTPPDFTRFIVESTVGEVVQQRLEALRESHAVEAAELEATEPSKKLARFWRDCFETLRAIKVCDPACGSGAFLIQAYDLLEEQYGKITDQLDVHGDPAADDLADTTADVIVSENLFGVDVSRQAVEIAQLALWIRSARRNRTLADLSRNVVCRNSLVTDQTVHPLAMVWEETFPEVFARQDAPGFDCVIGNPPWERMKLQEREFFAFSAPQIAGAVSAATRRKMIAELEHANPELYARYSAAKDAAEATLAHVRDSGNYPLTAKGDVNTYTVFAELAQKIVAPRGRVGLLVPSGIASDKTASEFFGGLIASRSLVSLHDFENKAPVFPDVHRSFKFSTLVFGGRDVSLPKADYVFFARRIEDVEDPKRHVRLSRKDVALMNPNTRTCPVFRSRRDADLTRAIYQRVPVLVDRTRKQGGNPWGIKFVTMFHQTNDAELFRTADDLKKSGCKPDGNRWTKGKHVFLPLYEAKMVQAYDHRAAGVVVQSANWVRQGQTEATTLVLHQNPEFAAQPRWWVEEQHVARAVAAAGQPAYLCYKDVTSPTNQRTMIAAMIPRVGVLNSAPLILAGEGISPRQCCCLLANLNSFALDFVARQKVGGVHLNFFIVEQLPVFPPDRYENRCPWDKRQKLETWISDRVLRLTCTSHDMRPLAEAAGFKPPVSKWNPAKRALWTAELDAAFFLLYGIGREDAEYVLGTFSSKAPGEGDAGALFGHGDPILEAYDRLCQTG